MGLVRLAGIVAKAFEKAAENEACDFLNRIW